MSVIFIAVSAALLAIANGRSINNRFEGSHPITSLNRRQDANPHPYLPQDTTGAVPGRRPVEVDGTVPPEYKQADTLVSFIFDTHDQNFNISAPNCLDRFLFAGPFKGRLQTYNNATLDQIINEVTSTATASQIPTKSALKKNKALSNLLVSNAQLAQSDAESFLAEYAPCPADEGGDGDTVLVELRKLQSYGVITRDKLQALITQSLFNGAVTAGLMYYQSNSTAPTRRLLVTGTVIAGSTFMQGFIQWAGEGGVFSIAQAWVGNLFIAWYRAMVVAAGLAMQELAKLGDSVKECLSEPQAGQAMDGVPGNTDAGVGIQSFEDAQQAYAQGVDCLPVKW